MIAQGCREAATLGKARYQGWTPSTFWPSLVGAVRGVGAGVGAGAAGVGCRAPFEAGQSEPQKAIDACRQGLRQRFEQAPQ